MLHEAHTDEQRQMNWKTPEQERIEADQEENMGNQSQKNVSDFTTEPERDPVSCALPLANRLRPTQEARKAE